MTPEELKTIIGEGLNAFRVEVDKKLGDLRAELTKGSPSTTATEDSKLVLQPVMDAIATLTEAVESLQKDVGEDGLVSAIDAVLDRVGKLEKHAAGRQSITGQEGELVPDNKPSLGDAIKKALAGEKVTIS